MPGRARIVIADDEPIARHMLGQFLTEEGHDVALAGDGAEALRLIDQGEPDLILTDLKMPVMDGLQLLRSVRESHPSVPVVIMTAQGSIRSAVESLRAGANDYLTKPVPLDELTGLVRRMLEETSGRNGDGAGEACEGTLDDVVGRSPRMLEIAALLHQVAPTQSSILLTGESGTGKDLIARAIHLLSPRAAAPFVKVSCAALPETLLESELFGHERGAFTGALSRRPGRFEIASGGTIFLDEVGDIPPAMQVKLLRFLQERQFERVGGNRTLTVDVRVIAATHRDLAALVAEGRFRDDLYWRLKVIEIPMPPLRARTQDIPLLADHFIRRFAQSNGKPAESLTSEALAAMMGYAWPGNVRELENAIERAVVLSHGRRLGLDLFPSLEATEAGRRPGSGTAIPGASLEEIEREAILKTLEAVGGSSIRAAAILRISPRTIQYKRKQWLTESPVTAPAEPLAGVGLSPQSPGLEPRAPVAAQARPGRR